MTSHEDYSITIHVRTVTQEEISHKQKDSKHVIKLAGE